ncbi:MAG: hypothetical protein AB1705_19295 [Verrucomicrobiota bacterium]
MYIEQAQSLARGEVDALVQQQDFLHENSNASDFEHIGPKFYPWGFPILLIPVLSCFGISFLALKVYVLLFFGLSLVIIRALFKGSLPPWPRCLLIAFIAFNPQFMGFHDEVMSDIPFMFFALLSLLLIQRIVVQGRGIFNKPADEALLGVCLFAAFSIRAIGVVLPLTLLICLYASDQRAHREKLRHCPGIAWRTAMTWVVFAALYVTYKWTTPTVSYASAVDWNQAMKYVMAGIKDYAYVPTAFFQAGILGKWVFICTIPFAVLGWIKSGKTTVHYWTYAVLSMGILLLWPWPLPRFLFSLIPFYLFYVLRGGLDCGGLGRATEPKRFRIISAVPAALLVVVVAVFAGNSASRFVEARRGGLAPLDGPMLPESQEVIDFLARHSEASDVVVFRKPRAIRLFVQRRVVVCDNLTHLRELRSRYKLFVVIDYGRAGWQLREPEAEQLQEVFRNKRFTVFLVPP